jgi:two-component system, OmpR family, response regulator
MDEFESLLSQFEDPGENKPARTEKPLVLVVDDDESMRRGLMRSLSARFSVLIAANGPDGLRIFDENDVCSVILDVKMPGMDGFEVCTRLRLSKKPDIPVLFLTAYQTEHDQRKIHDLYRPFAYLDKGGDNDLSANVERAVQSYLTMKETDQKSSSNG